MAQSAIGNNSIRPLISPNDRHRLHPSNKEIISLSRKSTVGHRTNLQLRHHGRTSCSRCADRRRLCLVQVTPPPHSVPAPASVSELSLAGGILHYRVKRDRHQELWSDTITLAVSLSHKLGFVLKAVHF